MDKAKKKSVRFNNELTRVEMLHILVQIAMRFIFIINTELDKRQIKLPTFRVRFFHLSFLILQKSNKNLNISYNLRIITHGNLDVHTPVPLLAVLLKHQYAEA